VRDRRITGIGALSSFTRVGGFLCYTEERILLYNLRISSIASDFTRIANIISTGLALDVVSSLPLEEPTISVGTDEFQQVVFDNRYVFS